MYGGVWYAGMVYAGYLFDPDDLGTLTISLNPCFDQAAGYAGSWYAGTVYAGSPFCIDLFGFFVPDPLVSNVLDLCIVRC